MDRKCLSTASKRRYAQISTKRREGLVQSIQEKGFSISRAAKRFNIKLSTAKLIWKRYKETGKFFPKKGRKEEECQSDASSNSLVLQQTQNMGKGLDQGLALETLKHNQSIMERNNQGLYACYDPMFFLPFWMVTLSNFCYDFHKF